MKVLDKLSRLIAFAGLIILVGACVFFQISVWGWFWIKIHLVLDEMWRLTTFIGITLVAHGGLIIFKGFLIYGMYLIYEGE